MEEERKEKARKQEKRKERSTEIISRTHRRQKRSTGPRRSIYLHYSPCPLGIMYGSRGQWVRGGGKNKNHIVISLVSELVSWPGDPLPLFTAFDSPQSLADCVYSGVYLGICTYTRDSSILLIYFLFFFNFILLSYYIPLLRLNSTYYAYCYGTGTAQVGFQE